MTDYALVVAAVFAVNLLPAFGPPTWAILVLFKLHLDLPAVPLVLAGATAAACGRLILANSAQLLGRHLSDEKRQALYALRDRMMRHRVMSVAGLGLFALSPVPSGQLFVAAGLFDLPLLSVTAAFFAGRIVSYAGYVSAASIVDRAATERALVSFRSPVGVAVQVVLLATLATVPLFVERRNLRARAAPADD